MNMIKKDRKFNILVIITLVCLSIVLTIRTLQNDTFYTIKIGESILENGLDMKEHFSFHQGLEYTYPHWLYDIGIFLIYEFFGMFGIYISTIILAFILLSTMYVTTKNIIKDKYIAYTLVTLSSVMLRPYITARAQLVTYILFLMILYFLEKLKETNKKRYAIYIILTAILIANVHVAVWPMILVLFLPYLVSDVTHMILNKFKNKKEEDIRIEIEEPKNFKLLLTTFIMTILTCFITPKFLLPFTYLLNTKKGITLANISEHRAITIEDKPMLFIILALIVFVLLQPKMKIKLKDLFFIAGLSLLSFMSSRSFSLFIILLLFSIGRLVKDYLSNHKKIKLEKILNHQVVYIVIITLLLSSAIVVYKHEEQKEFIDSTKYPIEAVKHIKKELNVDEIRLYNEYNFGSYLIYKDIKPFIDSRADLYTEEFNKGCTVFKDSVTIFKNYEATFNDYGITHILLYKKNKLTKILELNTEYKNLYEDNYFVLYEKIKGE